MNRLDSRPILTEIFTDPDDFMPCRGSAYIFGSSQEQRGEHSKLWIDKVTDNGISLVEITDQRLGEFDVTLPSGTATIRLRATQGLRSFWTDLNVAIVYINITELRHHVWAPLLRAVLLEDLTVSVVYVQPEDYTPIYSDIEGKKFEFSLDPDLSEVEVRSGSIPGFVKLQLDDFSRTRFVALLGFEGYRFARLIEQEQPPIDRIIPIIGIPGFRPEYPFFSYIGNRLIFGETKMWKDARFAAANCPFRLYYALEDIAAEYSNEMLKIALIGTKPHALGAILFALKNDNRVEIIYDNPKQKPNWTQGTSQLLIYHLSHLSIMRP